MSGSALATDAQQNDSHLDGTSCVVYAQDKANEYGATLRFIGLLAGIGGDDDVKAARALVKQLIEELGVPTDLRQAADAEERARSDMEQAGRDHDLARLLHGPESMETQRALLAKNRSTEAFENARAQRTALMHQSFKDFWSNLWSSIRSTYDAMVKALQDGTWKQALCRASVDAGFALAETGVAAALSAIGLAGAAYLLRIVARVAQKSTNLVKITVKASRNALRNRRVEAGIGKADLQRDFHREIDVNSELTDPERRLLGSENQGTTKPDPQKGDVDNGRQGSAKPIDRLDWRRELNSRGVTDADIKLAGSAGTTQAHVDARKKLITAYSDAYKGASKDLNSGTSLDLRRPISVRPVRAGEKMFQWNGEGRPPGNWLDPTSGGDPHSLGIAPYGREGSSVVFTEDSHGLLGTGARAGIRGDDWTTKSSSFDYRGGGQQLYVPKDMKPAISLDSKRPKIPWREAIRGNEADIAKATTLKPNWEDTLLDESLEYGRSYKNFSDIVNFYDEFVVKPP